MAEPYDTTTVRGIVQALMECQEYSRMSAIAIERGKDSLGERLGARSDTALMAIARHLGPMVVKGVQAAAR